MRTKYPDIVRDLEDAAIAFDKASRKIANFPGKPPALMNADRNLTNAYAALRKAVEDLRD